MPSRAFVFVGEWLGRLQSLSWVCKPQRENRPRVDSTSTLDTSTPPSARSFGPSPCPWRCGTYRKVGGWSKENKLHGPERRTE